MIDYARDGDVIVEAARQTPGLNARVTEVVAMPDGEQIVLRDEETN